jgi:hypothetical protein
MEDMPLKHLKDIYGLNPNIPHLALQFPRLPLGLTNSMFKIFENPMKEKFAEDNASINKKLQGFQQSYQRYASGLLTMNSNGIIPPGHPLFNWFHRFGLRSFRPRETPISSFAVSATAQTMRASSLRSASSSTVSIDRDPRRRSRICRISSVSKYFAGRKAPCSAKTRPPVSST